MQHIQSNASHDLSIGALRSIVKLVGSTSYSEIATLIIHTLLIGTLAFIVRQSGMWLKERITGGEYVIRANLKVQICFLRRI